MRGAGKLSAILLSVAVIAACAPKTVPLPVVSTPKYPEFVRPAVPAELAKSVSAYEQDRGWTFLQAGDLKDAEQEFRAALISNADFYPAETALGYVELARKDERAALTHFDRVLGRRASEASALVGRGEAYVALNREADALAAFQAAVAADPSLTEIQRRVEVLTFRRLEANLAAARTAARAGRLDEAIRVYEAAITASPDSPFLYRELAGVERQKGDIDGALARLRKALDLEPNDAPTLVQVGDLLTAKGDVDGAVKVYSDALAIDANPAVEAKLDAARARAELARLPEEYRAIEGEAQLTRADLAALIGVRLAPIVSAADSGRNVALVTDVRDNWAAPWIMAVTRAGIMAAFANHTFQPGAPVHRVELATAVSRVLTRIASKKSPQPSWETARLKFIDLPPSHLAYRAASAAVSAKVMTASDGAFEPNRIVTGAEGVSAVERLQELADLSR